MTSALPRGRPVGSVSFDPEIAAAFGHTLREVRSARGMSQQALALEASIERAHLGRIERGERVPTLAAIVKIARALGCTSAELIADFESNLIARVELRGDEQ